MTRPVSRAFLDTNILLYTISSDPKAPRAIEMLERAAVISVQVLNEFANTVRRKMALDLGEIVDVLGRFRAIYEIVPLTTDIHDHALQIAGRYGFSIHDSLIVAAALDAGCDTLYSEDLQHGQRIEARLDVVNPFLGTP